MKDRDNFFLIIDQTEKEKKRREKDPWAFAKKEKPDKKSGWLDGDWTKKEKQSDDPWAFAREEKE